MASRYVGVLSTVIILILTVLLVAASATSASADNGRESLRAQRFDVQLEVLPNSDLLVTETQTITITQGSLSSGFRELPLSRIERITDVRVGEPEQIYRPARSGNYTYSVDTEGDALLIDWRFPYTGPESSRTFILSYRAIGALRFYEGGDQLYWQAIFADRSYPIDDALVTVRLPVDLPASELKLAAYPESLDVEMEMVDSRTIAFLASDLPPGVGLEVRVQFPHGVVVGTPPSWQAQADREDWVQENVRPILDVFLVAISAFLLLGGSLAILLLWHTRGRDPEISAVATELSEPPSSLPPGIVGTLVDETADVRDAVATLVDLARRGYLRILETAPGNASTKRSFSFERTETPALGLRSFERSLIERLFSSGKSASLREVAPRLQSLLPAMINMLHTEVVKAELFPESPQTVRLRYAGLGGALIAVATLLGVLVVGLFSWVTEWLIAPFLSLGLLGILLMTTSWAMPRRTQRGALEAAKWRAFSRYLEKTMRGPELGTRLDMFDRYLPYAIAFGLDKEWVAKFAAVDTPVPYWYVPLSQSSRVEQRGTAPASSSEERGSQTSTGIPSLQLISDSSAVSLQSISDGLVGMLNGASESFRPPSSSGGSGGRRGGWSGGRSGGGGGGGGGRGGFR